MRCICVSPPGYLHERAMDALLKSTDLDWVIIRATGNVSKRRRRVPIVEICATRDATDWLEFLQVLPQ